MRKTFVFLAMFGSINVMFLMADSVPGTTIQGTSAMPLSEVVAPRPTENSRQGVVPGAPMEGKPAGQLSEVPAPDLTQDSGGIASPGDNMGVKPPDLLSKGAPPAPKPDALELPQTMPNEK